MPPEWARHERTLVAWPARTSLWGPHLETAKTEYAGVIRALSRFEPVLVVADTGARDEASTACGEGVERPVEVVEERIDDSWIRDNGPIVVRDEHGARVALDFRFNAWGRKFEPYDADAAVARRIAERLDLPMHEVDFVLEGGAITVDGAGTLVTTEQCLLNPNRNPGLGRDEVEAVLAEWLGARRVVWLARGLVEDRDTDGHVDNVCAFVGEGTVVAQGVPEDANPNAAILADNRARLEAAGLEVRSIDVLPYDTVGDRRVVVPPLNSYVVNGGALVPVAGGDPASADAAVARMQEVWPDREVVPVRASVLAFGGGGVHCVTQQVPA
jgi:agmatine deiminase